MQFYVLSPRCDWSIYIEWVLMRIFDMDYNSPYFSSSHAMHSIVSVLSRRTKSVFIFTRIFPWWDSLKCHGEVMLSIFIACSMFKDESVCLLVVEEKTLHKNDPNNRILLAWTCAANPVFLTSKTGTTDRKNHIRFNSVANVKQLDSFTKRRFTRYQTVLTS